MDATDRYGTPLEDPRPTLRYDKQGDLYVDFPPELVEAQAFPVIRYLLTNDLAAEVFDWEPLGGTVWLRWDIARLVEDRLLRMWPACRATADANPAYSYGRRAVEIAGRR